MKILALILFALMYVCLIGFPKRRLQAVWIVALVYVVSGILPFREIPGAIDWNATYNPPDGKHYEPGEDIPMGAWEDPSNWTPNFPITVQFEDVDQYGTP